MQENIDLSRINDVTQLKALKSDQYERIANANSVIAQAYTNLAVINTRMSHVISDAGQAAPQTNGATDAVGTGEMQPVSLDVTPKSDPA